LQELGIDPEQFQ